MHHGLFKSRVSVLNNMSGNSCILSSFLSPPFIHSSDGVEKAIFVGKKGKPLYQRLQRRTSGLVVIFSFFISSYSMSDCLFQWNQIVINVERVFFLRSFWLWTFAFIYFSGEFRADETMTVRHTGLWGQSCIYTTYRTDQVYTTEMYENEKYEKWRNFIRLMRDKILIEQSFLSLEWAATKLVILIWTRNQESGEYPPKVHGGVGGEVVGRGAPWEIPRGSLNTSLCTTGVTKTMQTQIPHRV